MNTSKTFHLVNKLFMHVLFRGTAIELSDDYGKFIKAIDVHAQKSVLVSQWNVS